MREFDMDVVDDKLSKDFPIEKFADTEADKEEYRVILENIGEIDQDPYYIVEYQDFDDDNCIRKVKPNLVFAEFLQSLVKHIKKEPLYEICVLIVYFRIFLNGIGKKKNGNEFCEEKENTCKIAYQA